MQIGSASSSSLGNGFQSSVFAQGMTTRKNSKLDAVLPDAPTASTAAVETGAQSFAAASAQYTATSSETLLTGGDSSNLMARNFVKLDFTQSKYVDASLQAARQEQSAVASMNAMITGLSSVAEMWTAEAASRGSEASVYVTGQLLGFLADTKLDQVKDEETTEASEENLEEIKEDVEARAEEAVSPEESGDGEGATTEGVTTESGVASDTESGAASGAESGETSSGTKDSVAADAANTAQTQPAEKSLTESIEQAAEAAMQDRAASGALSRGVVANGATAPLAASATQGTSAGGVATALAPRSVNIFV